MVLVVCVLSLLVTLLTIVLCIRRRYSYWKSIGAPCEEPVFPFGNIKDAQNVHISQVYDRIYRKFKGKVPFVGLYIFLQPAALILDLDLAKRILVKDFQYFHDRGHYFNQKDDPMSAHLFSLYGQEWRNLRTKLTPTFTSGKMKLMFPSVVQLGRKLVEHLSRRCTESEVFDIKQPYELFTTDVIGSIAFGIECNSLSGKNLDFTHIGRRIVVEPRHSFPITLLLLSFRNLANKLGIKHLRDDFTNFFRPVVAENIKYRDENNIKRYDFFHLLLEARKDCENGPGLSFNEILGQVFIFFLAGYETSSSLLSFCTYELALNPEIQSNARSHVNEILAKHNGDLTYECLHDMTYLDQVLNEALRKYPPIAFLTRIAMEDYRIPDTSFTFKKGTFVLIPSYSIQNDDQYFKNPEVFNPENYSKENVSNRHPLTYLPFGEGPRNCIGMRFGFMQAKIALALVLQKFRFSLSSKTEVPLQFRPKLIILASKDGIYLKAEEIC